MIRNKVGTALHTRIDTRIDTRVPGGGAVAQTHASTEERKVERQKQFFEVALSLCR